MSAKPVLKYAVALVVVVIVVVAAVFVTPGLLKQSQPSSTGTSSISSTGAKTIVVGAYGGAYDQALEAVAKNFTSQTGIQVQVVNVGSASVELPKVLAGDSGLDVWASNDISVITAAGGGVLVPLDGTPNVDSLPASLKVRINGTTYAAHYDSGANGLVYNSQILKNVPSTWQEFIKMIKDGSIPGKVGISGPERNDAAIITQMALIAGGDEKNQTSLAWAWQTLKEIAPHISYVYQGGGSMISALSGGDVTAIFPQTAANAYAGFKAGAPVKFKILGGTPILLDNDPMVVLKGRNQKEAVMFLNYCLSPIPNSVIAMVEGKLPANPQSPVPESSLNFVGMPLAQMYSHAHVVDYAYISAHYNDWLNQWNKEIKPLFNA
ncbi:MAG TPA: extracellular solute-binding protein [Candidatus Bathyarchaeia archaeon]|nr:extracellular solute-binding protein [Candidatus Bathyarchaeia archaeon]